MEQDSRARDFESADKLNWLFAVFAILVVLLQVVVQWHTFGAVSKFTAVVLLAILAYTPRALGRVLKKNGKTEISKLLPFVYIPAALASVLFRLH
jgi:hypothetical protein